MFAGGGQVDVAGAGAWYGVAMRGISDKCWTGSNQILLYLAHDACVRYGLQHGSVGKTQPRRCVRVVESDGTGKSFPSVTSQACAPVMECDCATVTSLPSLLPESALFLRVCVHQSTIHRGSGTARCETRACIDRAGLGDFERHKLPYVSFVRFSFRNSPEAVGRGRGRFSLFQFADLYNFQNFILDKHVQDIPCCWLTAPD